MRDIVISGRIVRRELLIAVSCFLLSFCINAGTVIAYVKPWTEIFSQIGYVVVISVVFYAVLMFFRILFLGLKKCLRALFCK